MLNSGAHCDLLCQLYCTKYLQDFSFRFYLTKSSVIFLAQEINVLFYQEEKMLPLVHSNHTNIFWKLLSEIMVHFLLLHICTRAERCFFPVFNGTTVETHTKAIWCSWLETIWSSKQDEISMQIYNIPLILALWSSHSIFLQKSHQKKSIMPLLNDIFHVFQWVFFYSPPPFPSLYIIFNDTCMMCIITLLCTNAIKYCLLKYMFYKLFASYFKATDSGATPLPPSLPSSLSGI